MSGGWSLVLPRGLLQDRVSASSKHPQCQAADGRLSEFQARCRLRLPVQMQPRLLREGQPRKQDAQVRHGMEIHKSPFIFAQQSSLVLFYSSFNNRNCPECLSRDRNQSLNPPRENSRGKITFNRSRPGARPGFRWDFDVLLQARGQS